MGLFAKREKAEVIKITAVDEEQFVSLYNKISEKNELLRCGHCGKLLSKVSAEGKTFQHRGIKIVVVKGEVMVKCGECGKVSRF